MAPVGGNNGNTIILAQQPQQPQLVLKQPMMMGMPQQQPQPMMMGMPQQQQPMMMGMPQQQQQQPMMMGMPQQPQPQVTVIRA